MSRKNVQEGVPTEGGTAPRLGQVEAHCTIGEVLSEESTVQPEPFGSELKAELLTAEGSRRWRSIARAQRFLPV
jgi:hypothetical protein